MRPAVIHAPDGISRTTNVRKLLGMFICQTVLENWDGKAPIKDDTLAITNRIPQPEWAEKYHVFSHADAVTIMGAPL